MVPEQEADRAVESFRGLVLQHRGRTGMTQRELSARVGVSRGSVQDWEAGVNYPDVPHLQALIVAFLDAGGLTVGGEAIEAEALWAAALQQSPRMQTPFDAAWWARLLGPRMPSIGRPDPAEQNAVVTEASPIRTPERRQDWGEAPDVLGFVGRVEELATLRDWMLEQRCRLTTILGMGGIGKTLLAARLAQDVGRSFERLYWRSLRDALSISEWLAGAIAFLSDQHHVAPEGETGQLTVLLQLLRDRPSLLVLDNFETLLEPGQREARYRVGFGGYGRLLQAVGEGRHQSCLLVTSRESPPELAILGGAAGRTLKLGGLGVAEGQILLANKQLWGSTKDWANLIRRFGGNGLALKLVGESIRELFGGDVRAFLGESGSGSIFGGIRLLLREQIDRSSALEQKLLRVLAIEREPVTIAQLITALGTHVARGEALEAVEALRRRSLVERTETSGAVPFTLQSVVLEFMTDHLANEVCDEIANGQPVQLVQQPLIKAQAKDYVRQSQERLIGLPILQKLEAESDHAGVEQRLLTLLDGWRDRPQAEQGYGPGNVVNLLRLLRGDLRSLDLGHLTLRQTYLAGVEAQDASLAHAHLSEVVLAEAFNYPISVALSGDGTLLLAGTSAGEIWLWRVADRTPLLKVQAHTAAVHSVALNADGRLLATGSLDGTVRVRETSSGRLLATLGGHAGGARAVTLSADGALLASGSQDGTVRLWDVSNGQLLATLQGHTAGVRGVALSADGRLLASGSEDGTVRLWELPAGRLLATLQGHTGGVWGVALSADGRLLASGGLDGTVRLWEVPTGRLLATLQGHTGGVWGVALSADGGLLASGGLDGTVRIWEPFALRQAQDELGASGQWRLLAALQSHTGGVRGVALSADGRLLASGGWDGTIRLQEPFDKLRVSGEWRLLATLQGHTSVVRGVTLSADGRLLASGSWDGTIRLQESPSGRLLATLQGHTSVVWNVAFSRDRRRLASASEDGTVRVWEPFALRQAQDELRVSGDWRLLATLNGHTGMIYAVTLSADGRLLASGSEDGTVRLWEPFALRQAQDDLGVSGQWRLLATLRGHTGAVRSVVLSADGQLLASGSEDGTIRLWEPFALRQAQGELRTSGDWRLLATLEGHTSVVWSVALSADRRLLASAGEDGTVRLWAAFDGHPLATLQGGAGPAYSVALATDGRLLASSSFDGSVRLWSLGLRPGQDDLGMSGAPDWRLLALLQGHTAPVYGVALAADGQLLASGSEDGTIRLWDATSGASVRTLRSDRRYERLDITGLTGVTAAQGAALLSLGAVDHQAPASVASRSRE